MRVAPSAPFRPSAESRPQAAPPAPALLRVPCRTVAAVRGALLSAALAVPAAFGAVATPAAGVVALGATASLAPLAGAQASPPAHAPAHGWRRKNDPSYAGYTGQSWERDYGVRTGRCDTDAVLAAVGAVAGGVIANRSASAEHRTVATIFGAVIGGVLGAKIGDAIDARDRACIGHSLELAGTGQVVTWTNPSTGIGYVVRPLRDLSGGCREFELVAEQRGRRSKDTLRACRGERADWAFRTR